MHCRCMILEMLNALKIKLFTYWMTALNLRILHEKFKVSSLKVFL